MDKLKEDACLMLRLDWTLTVKVLKEKLLKSHEPLLSWGGGIVDFFPR